MLKRRVILGGLAGLAATRSGLLAGAARAQDRSVAADLRGAFDASEAGVVPGAADNQSRKLQALLEAAARRGQPVYLPAGTYEVSNLDLPDGTRLLGDQGATRLAYSGDGHLISARDVHHVALSGITLDGANRWLADYTQALVSFRSVDDVQLISCEIAGSRKHGVQLERSGGKVQNCRITGAADAGLMAIETMVLAVRDNDVTDCGNGGILVHRWTKGVDGAFVTGNRIARIAARAGGTGQNGNGINLFRADNVIVSGNHVTDCAFSAIRANSASNVTISGNQCFASGETAIYAEFAFEGAVIADNIVDGAANGILVVNLDEGGRLSTVSGNVIRNLRLKGPYVHDGAGFGFGIAVEADAAVTGNVVETAPKWGIMLGWGPYLRNVVASGNVIRDCPVGMAVSVVEGSGSALIANNLIGGATTGAILGYRWNDKATDELIDGEGGFSHLTIIGNRRG